MKKKLFIVAVCGSSEYGCSISSTYVFATKEEAHEALEREYHEALTEFRNEPCEDDENEIELPTLGKDFFEVKDYECSYYCTSGRIDEVEVEL